MNRSESGLTRRELLQCAATAGVAVTLGNSLSQAADLKDGRPTIIDSNVSLFDWPFRQLPLNETSLLIKKLHSLGVVQAWAGSYEGILHRDLSSVNQRLAEECQKYPELIPFGTINVSLPGWEDDFRDCIAVHQMPGVRVYPGYHGYALDDPRFQDLLKRAASQKVLVQIVVSLEDTRTQSHLLRVADLDLQPLPEVVKQIPDCKVQLLNARPRSPLLKQLEETPGIYFDTARVDGTDGVPKLIEAAPAGRVLFGSHAPFLIPEAPLVRVYEARKLDAPALAALLSGNASRLLESCQITQASAVRERKPEAVPTTIDARQIHAGLPGQAQLKRYRIWDSYFTPSHSNPGRDGSSRLIADIERALPAARTGQFEKLCYFAHVGLGTTSDSQLEQLLRAQPDVVLKPLERWPELLIGMMQLNANDVPASLAALDQWIKNGPMRGVYFASSGPGAQVCTHPNFNPLVERIGELNGVIMQHTWFKTGGKGGPGESTPDDLVVLAKRFPDQQFLCAHAGGEWEQGIRAVRDCGNILVETSGFDPTAGFIEMAVRELGAERVVFGSHLPSRSLGTELCKVTCAQITEQEKFLILGENYRRLLAAQAAKAD
ncbi:amidohydrolase family protein [Gimesia sp.]|uniref:amidohydrolase family protein n=1 Tax=Gimesia sp. TaxID=2024833 RepID=UPI0032ED6289